MFQRATVRGVAAVLAAVVVVSFTGCQYMPKVKMPSMPRLWPAKKVTAASEYDAAKKLYTQGKHDAAVKAFDAWLQKNAKTPLEPAALYHLARSQFHAGQAKKAEATYKLLIQDYKGSRWAAFAQEDLSHVTAPMPNLPDYKRKTRWWRPGDWLKPKLPIVKDFETARTHFRKGRYNQAIVGFRTLAEKNPKSPLAPASWYWVARSHEELDQKDKAGEVFQQLVDKFPGTEWEKHAKEGLQRLKAK
ncbi:tetratricopeptide repeat protein [bacterium]|nr:tetratricopeptide repeat protein [bacterium]